MENIHDLRSGKTFPEPSPATTDGIFTPFCSPSAKSQAKELLFLNLQRGNGAAPDVSWETVIPSRGEPWMRNTGESPSAVVESILWQILEANVPEKYYLSPKACQGILKRAERRGKKLPAILREALEEAITLG